MGLSNAYETRRSSVHSIKNDKLAINSRYKQSPAVPRCRSRTRRFASFRKTSGNKAAKCPKKILITNDGGSVLTRFPLSDGLINKIHVKV